jgi:hypothetical protein
MDHNDFSALLATLSGFGGVALIIWTSIRGKIALIKAKTEAHQMAASPQHNTSVIAELQALRQQIAEMQSTSHQFDISFDAALGRLEGRVNRLETKSAATSTGTTETEQTLRNGQTL